MHAAAQFRLRGRSRIACRVLIAPEGKEAAACPSLEQDTFQDTFQESNSKSEFTFPGVLAEGLAAMQAEGHKCPAHARFQTPSERPQLRAQANSPCALFLQAMGKVRVAIGQCTPIARLFRLCTSFSVQMTAKNDTQHNYNTCKQLCEEARAKVRFG
eukprot:1153644-Pelagomonas_calceolata.AAC.2